MKNCIKRRRFLELAGAASVALLPSFALPGYGEARADDALKPLTSAQQTQVTASEAVALIKSGRLSAEDYVTNALERSRSIKDLNTLITENWEAAIRSARKVDEDRKAGRVLPPLAGLPIVIKDNINVKGMPTTSGTLALRNFAPSATAPIVQRLLDAGAIIVGKANMHELAFGITNVNFDSFPGTVRNPYDPSRIAGGSSGGTACAIAAGLVPAGLGTDTSGSVRIPASLCGVVGLRPTVGNGGAERRYDASGVFPISHTKDTIGPMAVSVADVALLDAVLTDSKVPDAVPLAGLRLATPKYFWSGLDKEVESVMEQVKQKLTAAGVVFVDVDMPTLSELNEKSSATLALHEPIADIPKYLTESGAEGITVSSIVAKLSNPDVKAALDLVLSDALGAGYPEVMATHRPQLRALYKDYFERNRVDAIFFPATPIPAIPIDQKDAFGSVSINGGPPAPVFNTYIQNTDPGATAGLPGLVLPAGRTTSGLPVGMELDGLYGTDKRLIGIGLSIERLIGRIERPY